MLRRLAPAPPAPRGKARPPATAGAGGSHGRHDRPISCLRTLAGGETQALHLTLPVLFPQTQTRTLTPAPPSPAHGSITASSSPLTQPMVDGQTLNLFLGHSYPTGRHSACGSIPDTGRVMAVQVGRLFGQEPKLTPYRPDTPSPHDTGAGLHACNTRAGLARPKVCLSRL